MKCKFYIISYFCTSNLGTSTLSQFFRLYRSKTYRYRNFEKFAQNPCELFWIAFDTNIECIIQFLFSSRVSEFKFFQGCLEMLRNCKAPFFVIYSSHSFLFCFCLIIMFYESRKFILTGFPWKFTNQSTRWTKQILCISICLLLIYDYH